MHSSMRILKRFRLVFLRSLWVNKAGSILFAQSITWKKVWTSFWTVSRTITPLTSENLRCRITRFANFLAAAFVLLIGFLVIRRRSPLTVSFWLVRCSIWNCFIFVISLFTPLPLGWLSIRFELDLSKKILFRDLFLEKFSLMFWSLAARSEFRGRQ